MLAPLRPKKRKKDFGHFWSTCLGKFSLFSSLNSLPNTSKNLLFLSFLNNQEVVLLHFFPSPWSQDLGFEVLRVQMQLFSYYLHPLLYLVLQYALSLSIVYLFLYLASQHVYLLSNMFYYFDVVGLAFLGQDMPKNHVYAYIYMFMCSLSCFCSDLHVYVLCAIFMLRSTCLCSLYHVYVSRSMCWMLCFVILQPLISYYAFFLCFGPQVGCRSKSCGLRLHPYTYAYIKRFGSVPLCVCMLTCFFSLYPCLPVQIQALPCFVPSVGLCFLVFGGHLLVSLICPSYGLFGCNHS